VKGKESPAKGHLGGGKKMSPVKENKKVFFNEFSKKREDAKMAETGKENKTLFAAITARK